MKPLPVSFLPFTWLAPQQPAITKAKAAREAKRKNQAATLEKKSAIAAAKNTLTGQLDESLLPTGPDPVQSALEAQEARFEALKKQKAQELEIAKAMFADLNTNTEITEIDDENRSQIMKMGQDIGEKIRAQS